MRWVISLDWLLSLNDVIFTCHTIVPSKGKFMPAQIVGLIWKLASTFVLALVSSSQFHTYFRLCQFFALIQVLIFILLCNYCYTSYGSYSLEHFSIYTVFLLCSRTQKRVLVDLVITIMATPAGNKLHNAKSLSIWSHYFYTLIDRLTA